MKSYYYFGLSCFIFWFNIDEFGLRCCGPIRWLLTDKCTSSTDTLSACCGIYFSVVVDCSPLWNDAGKIGMNWRNTHHIEDEPQQQQKQYHKLWKPTILILRFSCNLMMFVRVRNLRQPRRIRRYDMVRCGDYYPNALWMEIRWTKTKKWIS